MDNIYDAHLRAMLDELYLKTTVTIPSETFNMWFGIRKISKTPYRYIQKEWDEVCNAHEKAWPSRTNVVKLRLVKNAQFNGLVIQRELFDDEVLVEFDQLTD